MPWISKVKLDVRTLMADIGKPDVVRFMGRMDEKFVRQYPSEPLRIRTGIDGDLNKLKLTTLTAELPGALGLFARGELTHLTDSLLRGGISPWKLKPRI